MQSPNLMLLCLFEPVKCQKYETQLEHRPEMGE